jgi:hypothetical protein
MRRVAALCCRCCAALVPPRGCGAAGVERAMAGARPWRRLVLCAATASLAGFLLGFDTIVISGAEQQIQQLWGLSGAVHGMCMSAALWGTVRSTWRPVTCLPAAAACSFATGHLLFD